ncbi:helix-turn-helix transcriptional regulator [Streptosporangium sp. NPDC049644]|uniref:helix-turn-helix transcriptional regulator n=1 Tax=Streptosporangium sp. NPDC049644 TaxID=3155507 RepID=UPI0034451884
MDLHEGLRRIAVRGGDLTEVRTELDRLLRRVIGYDIAAISTVDPATLLWTSCFVTGIGHEGGADRERIIFDLEFRDADLNGYTRLANAAVPVAGLHQATGGRISEAARYEPLLRELGICDEARVMLRSRNGCWGSLTLYRCTPSPPFGAAELAALTGAVSLIADLFRLTLLRAALDVAEGIEDPPGMLLVRSGGEVETLSTQARTWLEAIDDRGRIPSVVRSVVAAAQAGNGPATAALPARGGRWVVLHGSPIEGSADRVALIVEGARPAVLGQIIARAYDLTSREREVTALAAQGRSTRQMAAVLGISPFTVQDHLKAVFAKTGTHSRGELVASLHTQHYAPRVAAGAAPSPYGWYLDDECSV